MNWCWTLPGLFALALNFDESNSEENKKRSVVKLLTQHEWRLDGQGFDANGNGLIEDGEQSLSTCEMDNSCAFKPNGTGLYFDNSISCGNGISEQSFKWRLISNESALVLNQVVLQIMKLDEHELVLADDSHGQVRSLTVFKH